MSPAPPTPHDAVSIRNVYQHVLPRAWLNLELCVREHYFWFFIGWVSSQHRHRAAPPLTACVQPTHQRRYTAREKYPEALRILADDVYHSSVAFGPESSQTAGGYYLMADVFDKYGDTDTSTVRHCAGSLIYIICDPPLPFECGPRWHDPGL